MHLTTALDRKNAYPEMEQPQWLLKENLNASAKRLRCISFRLSKGKRRIREASSLVCDPGRKVGLLSSVMAHPQLSWVLFNFRPSFILTEARTFCYANGSSRYFAKNSSICPV